MKVIIGLGNPGKNYAKTRHNTGHMVIDELHKQISNFQFSIFNQIKILKSDKFMNESGEFVKKILNSSNLDSSNLIVVHDDLDIPLGHFKIQFGKGPKDHNGILSIEKEIETKDFWRIRIGVENRNLESRISNLGKNYVLQNFTDEERKILDGVIKNACKKLETLINSK